VARSRRSSHNLLWCRVWWTCRCWPNRRRRCRWRDRNGMISRYPMRRSIISANRRRVGRRRGQNSRVSPAPLWQDRFFDSQRRDRMTDRLTILSFGFTKPLRWHGWVMKIGYTRLSWYGDEVGVVLWCWGQLSKSYKRVYQTKKKAKVRWCQQISEKSTPRQPLRNLNTHSYERM
jgi:hypothetical protein